MKYFSILIVTFLFINCTEQKEQCEVCEVLKNGQMIEKYESCDNEGMKASKSICQEMSKLQGSECKCHKKDKP